MKRPRVYVETTIPSFYFDGRQTPGIAEARRVTREWWERAIGTTEMVTSSAVLLELRKGPEHKHPEWFGLLRGLALLDVTPRVGEIAAHYVRHRLMPGPPSIDALHLALACHYHCDILATWDTRHLANPNKAAHFRRLNTALGESLTQALTPGEILSRRPR